MPTWLIVTLAIVGNAIIYLLLATKTLQVSFLIVNGQPIVDAIFGDAPEFIKAFFRLPEVWIVLALIGVVFLLVGGTLYGIGWLILKIVGFLIGIPII